MRRFRNLGTAAREWGGARHDDLQRIFALPHCSIARNITNAFSDVADKCERIKARHNTTFPLDNQAASA